MHPRLLGPFLLVLTNTTLVKLGTEFSETPCMWAHIQLPWIYRTLMHNALRDDGKYGYITRQRPMLFSLASHWLMLIRKSNGGPDEYVERRWGTFIKAGTVLSLLFLLRSGTVKKGVPLKSREIALQSPPTKKTWPIIRGRGIPSEYQSLGNFLWHGF